MYTLLDRGLTKAVIFIFLLLNASTVMAAIVTWDESIDGELTLFNHLQFDVGVNTIVGDTGYSSPMQFAFIIPEGVALTSVDYTIHNITLSGTATGIFVETYFLNPNAVSLNEPLYPVDASYIGESPPGSVSVTESYTYSPGDEGALFNNILLGPGEYYFYTRVGFYGSYPGGGVMDNTFQFKLTPVPVPPTFTLFSLGVLSLIVIVRKKNLCNETYT